MLIQGLSICTCTREHSNSCVSSSIWLTWNWTSKTLVISQKMTTQIIIRTIPASWALIQRNPGLEYKTQVSSGANKSQRLSWGYQRRSRGTLRTGNPPTYCTLIRARITMWLVSFVSLIRNMSNRSPTLSSMVNAMASLFSSTTWNTRYKGRRSLKAYRSDWFEQRTTYTTRSWEWSLESLNEMSQSRVAQKVGRQEIGTVEANKKLTKEHKNPF